MTTKRLVATCIAVALSCAGCTTSDVQGQRQAVGKTISFITKEAAPAEFDAWTFFWQSPAIERFDADLQYVVLLPDGKEYYVHDCGMLGPGQGVRSDFWADMFKLTGMPERDMIRPFRGQPIAIVFRATKGRIRFAAGSGGGFAFYKKGAKGEIDRDHPVKQIEAVMK